MNILVINKFGHNKLKESDVIPRVGDKVDMFYTPHPTVTNVLMWPSEETHTRLGASMDIDAIITVE